MYYNVFQTNKPMSSILSKCIRQAYQNIFETSDSEISDDDEIIRSFTIFSRIGVQIITIQRDESD